MEGFVHSIETFGSVDGPGVRFVVFLQGCCLRCRYCHNPDTWSLRAAGTQTWTARDILTLALRYRPYWGSTGGITASGGDPLMQTEFLLELFTLAKAQGIHTALDTSGGPYQPEGPFHDLFLRLMAVTDLVLLDLKQMDPEKHKALTGRSNANILQMARELDSLHKPVWIRHVLVPGYTDDPADQQKLKDFLHSLSNVQRVEVLPYHTLGVYKYEILGMQEPLPGVPPAKEEEAEALRQWLLTP